MISMYGDWKKCRDTLTRLSVRLFPIAQAKLYEDGKIVLEALQGHIDKQDLPWKQLSELTVKLKQDETIYLETGFLRDNIGVTKVKSSNREASYFIGASPWARHPESGLKCSDIMMYMEHGTVTQPGRPLVKPTYDEVNAKLKSQWKQYMKEIVSGGRL